MTTITITSAANEVFAALTSVAHNIARRIAANQSNLDALSTTDYPEIFSGMFGSADQISEMIAIDTAKLDEILRAADALSDTGIDYNPDRPQLWIANAVAELADAHEKLSRLESGDDREAEAVQRAIVVRLEDINH